MTVREILEACARGEITQAVAEARLQEVRWRSPRRRTVEVLDVPPPDDNSPDWIEIVAGLSPAARATFTAIYDNRPRRAASQ